MISRFFIDRPIFATVLSIVITLAGGHRAALPAGRPVPARSRRRPCRSRSATPGPAPRWWPTRSRPRSSSRSTASRACCTCPRRSGNDGSYTLTVTFDIGTDLNTALVMVQNRVHAGHAAAADRGPAARASPSARGRPTCCMIVNFYSPGRPLRRHLPEQLRHRSTSGTSCCASTGVSDINILGQRDYSIRAWLDPQKLAAREHDRRWTWPTRSARQNLEAARRRRSASRRRGRASRSSCRSTRWAGSPTRSSSATSSSRSARPRRRPCRPATGGGARRPAGRPARRPADASIAGSRTPTARPPSRARRSRPPPSGTTTGLLSATAPRRRRHAGDSPRRRRPARHRPGDGGTGGGPTGQRRRPTGAVDDPSGTAGGAPLRRRPAGRAPRRPRPARPAALVGPSALAGGGAGPRPGPPAAGIVRLRDVARVELAAAELQPRRATFDGQPVRRPGRLPAARHQRPRRRRPRPGQDGGAEDALPRGRRLRHRLRHHAVHPRVDRRGGQDAARGGRPGRPSWCWSSCRTGGRRSSRWSPCPVAIVGTFAVMAALGFSLNNISLFGLVLAIGIVVDDAIVVVENVERQLEHGLAPREAAHKAMDEVTGPVIAVGPGAVRRVRAVRVHQRHHRPVLPAVRRDDRRLDGHLGLQLADPEPGPGRHPAPEPGPAGGPHGIRSAGRLLRPGCSAGSSGCSTAAFDAGHARPYAWAVGRLLRGRACWCWLVYGGLLGADVLGRSSSAPTGFIPQQDQGRLHRQRPAARLGLAASGPRR